MQIRLNGRIIEASPGTTLGQLRDKHKPGADVLVQNGFPAKPDSAVSDGDEVVLIRRGETPAFDEFEAALTARHTPGVHGKIKKACVGVAGLGGLGSAVTVALARLGVGRLVLADFDVLEPSNLNRQQYFIEQLGAQKTLAMRENLERINPYVDVSVHTVRLTQENVPVIFKDVDVLVEAFDVAAEKTMLVESFGAAFPEKPVVMASGLAGHGPGGDIKLLRMGKNIYIVGDLESGAKPGAGLMAPRVGIAAHMQANTVLRILLGEEGEKPA
jgi:sulfur carrier protein ThiS adenylyltransferase